MNKSHLRYAAIVLIVFGIFGGAMLYNFYSHDKSSVSDAMYKGIAAVTITLSVVGIELAAISWPSGTEVSAFFQGKPKGAGAKGSDGREASIRKENADPRRAASPILSPIDAEPAHSAPLNALPAQPTTALPRVPLSAAPEVCPNEQCRSTDLQWSGDSTICRRCGSIRYSTGAIQIKPVPGQVSLSFEDEMRLRKQQYYAKAEEQVASPPEAPAQVIHKEEPVPKAAVPAKAPEKVKVKFEMPFGKKKPDKLRELLEEEDRNSPTEGVPSWKSS